MKIKYANVFFSAEHYDYAKIKSYAYKKIKRMCIYLIKKSIIIKKIEKVACI